MLSLETEKRETGEASGKTGALKKNGRIPAVYYGPKQASTPISVKAAEFAKIWKKAGESSVVVLKEGSSEHEVLIYAVDLHPVTGEPRHADFYVFEKGKKIKLKAPIEFTGTAPAVKDLGGVLVKVLHEIEIEAAPKDLPHSVSVNISPLVNFESQITAKEIVLPAGVSLVTGGDEVVASVYEPKEEIEEQPAAPDLSAIEVEKKGKEAKEGEGEGEEAASAKASGKEPAAKEVPAKNKGK